MTQLVVCLSSENPSISYITKLIKDHNWDKIIILNSNPNNPIKKSDNLEIININSSKPLIELANDLKNSLQGKITDIEVATNFVSGSGKEHMAIVSALLKLGLGIRFIALKPNGIEEI